MYFSHAVRKNRFQSVLLLPPQNRKRTEFRFYGADKRFRIGIELFHIIGRMHHRQQCKHHSFIPHGNIIQKILDFLSHLPKVIGNVSTEIVVVILLSLPSGYVRFHRKQLVLHLFYRLIRRNRKNINRKHDIF